jgi:YVTN family beta-propeller protein
MLVVDSIATGGGPKGIVLDLRRRRAYVAVSGDNAVEVYDLVTGRFISRIQLNFGDHPTELAITPDGRTLVSANYASNTVSIIDAIAMFQLQRIRVGEGPTSVVVDPSGFKAFVMNSLSSTVSVVDLTQRTVIVTISVQGSPLRGAFNRPGNRLFVISENSPNLQVIDPSQYRVIEKIFIGMGAASIVDDLRTGLVLVGNKFAGEITIVDPLSSMSMDTIPLRGNAAFMTIDRQENTLFIVTPGRRKLLKINLTSKKTMGEIEVREGAYAVVVVGER